MKLKKLKVKYNIIYYLANFTNNIIQEIIFLTLTLEARLLIFSLFLLLSFYKKSINYAFYLVSGFNAGSILDLKVSTEGIGAVFLFNIKDEDLIGLLLAIIFLFIF